MPPEDQNNPIKTEPVAPTGFVSSQPPVIQQPNTPIAPPTQQPNMGAGQSAPYNPKFAVPSPIQDYRQVPLYRRRWFVVTLTLLIVPLGSIIVWTGNVYLQNQKTKVVFMFTKLQKVYFTLAGLLIILNNIIRLH